MAMTQKRRGILKMPKTYSSIFLQNIPIINANITLRSRLVYALAKRLGR